MLSPGEITINEAAVTTNIAIQYLLRIQCIIISDLCFYCVDLQSLPLGLGR